MHKRSYPWNIPLAIHKKYIDNIWKSLFCWLGKTIAETKLTSFPPQSYYHGTDLITCPILLSWAAHYVQVDIVFTSLIWIYQDTNCRPSALKACAQPIQPVNQPIQPVPLRISLASCKSIGDQRARANTNRRGVCRWVGTVMFNAASSGGFKFLSVFWDNYFFFFFYNLAHFS